MKTVKSILAVVAFLFILGYVGRKDMVNEVIYTMPSETYHDIKDSLTFHGEEPSDAEIAEFYMEMN